MIIPAPPKGFVLEDEEPSSYMGQDYAEARSALPRRDTAYAGGNVPPPPAGFVLEDEQREPTRDGLRPDGTKKGKGFFGELKLPGGGVATEYSVGVQLESLGGKETDIPSLVPTLTPEERELMINDIIPNKKPIPDSIVQKAVDHANMRVGEGKDVFFQEGEDAGGKFRGHGAQGSFAPVTLGEKIISDPVMDILGILPFSPLHDWRKKGAETAKQKLRTGDYGQRQYAMGGHGFAGFRPARPKQTTEQLTKIVEDQAELEARGETIPAAMGGGIANLPAYMIEMMAGGIGGVKSVPGAAKFAAKMTALQPARIESAMIDQIERGETGGMALVKAWGDVYIENISETAGAGFGKAVSKLPFGGKLMEGMRKFAKSKGMSDSKFWKEVGTKVGYNGILGEWGEERIGTYLRGLTDVQDFGAGKDATADERIAAGFKQDFEARNMLIEAGVLLAPGVAKYAGQKILGPEPGRKTPYEDEPSFSTDAGRRAMQGQATGFAPPISEAIQQPTGLPPAQELPEGSAESTKLEAAKQRAAEKLSRKVTKAGTGKAEGPLVGKLYSHAEELIEKAQSETDEGNRNAILDELEQVDNTIGQLSRENLEGKDIAQLEKMARRFGVEVPKGADKDAIIGLLAGKADLSQIKKTDSGYRIEIPIADTKAGRAMEVHEFDSYAEALYFLEDREGEGGAAVPVSTEKPPQAPVTQEVTPQKPDTGTPVEALKPIIPAQTQPKEQIVSPVSVEPPPGVSVEKETGRVQTEGEAAVTRKAKTLGLTNEDIAYMISVKGFTHEVANKLEAAGYHSKGQISYLGGTIDRDLNDPTFTYQEKLNSIYTALKQDLRDDIEIIAPKETKPAQLPTKKALPAKQAPAEATVTPQIHEKSIAAVSKAIEEKDADTLINWLHSGNKNLRKMFTDKTGVKLPATHKGMVEAINDWSKQETPKLKAREGDTFIDVDGVRFQKGTAKTGMRLPKGMSSADVVMKFGMEFDGVQEMPIDDFRKLVGLEKPKPTVSQTLSPDLQYGEDYRAFLRGEGEEPSISGKKVGLVAAQNIRRRIEAEEKGIAGDLEEVGTTRLVSGVISTLTNSTEDENGIVSELWIGEDKHTLRVVDKDSGEIVQSKTFTDRKQAAAEYEKRAGEKATPSPVATPVEGVEKPIIEKTPESNLIDNIITHFENGKSLDAKTFFEMADKAYGGTRAEGAYGPSDAYDVLETAVNKYIGSAKGLNPSAPYGEAVEHAKWIENELLDRLPSQTNRSGEKDLMQQFSTPPHYSYAVAWAANIGENDIVLEPSAGTGSLVVHAINAGPKAVYVNELSERRAMLLKNLGVDKVFTEDAEQIHNILPQENRPTVILMNPPFSHAASRMGDKKVYGTDLKHIDAALNYLQDGGRLVAIMGRPRIEGEESSTFQRWAKEAGKKYDVRANVHVGRKVYKKYGTQFPTRILIIDKTGPQKGEILGGTVDTIPDLMYHIEGVRNDRIEAKPEQVGAGRKEVAGQRETGAEPGQPIQPSTPSLATGKVRTGRPLGETPGRISGESKEDVGVEAEPGAGGVTKGLQRGREGAEKREQIRDVAPGESGRELESKLKAESREQRKKTKDKLSENIFESYQPSKFHLKNAKSHPAALVESTAMAAVSAPDITYELSLPQKIVDKGLLSEIQLEVISYAGQSHEQLLPKDAQGVEYRRGFFIGDGTGVGKGREISGIILDNWNKGRKKALWISVSKDLLNDAKRDWSGIGQDEKMIFPFKSGELKAKQGIMYATYDTLKWSRKAVAGKEAKSNLDAIVEWLGKDFDGVIAFDESHKMGNAMRLRTERGVKEPSKRALVGMDLQKKLPNARIVYVSATGATEVENLTYAQRLGLWGPGTPFANAADFVGEMATGGIANMELIARDLKALGLYQARSIAYNDGTEEGTVTFEQLEHQLTDDQKAIYNKLAEGWQVVLQNFDKALEITGGDKDWRAKGRAKSAFYGTQQRFFNQVLTAMQTPSAIRSMEQKLKDGHSIVIQLTNTMEAAQERALANMTEDQDLEDFDITPRDALLQMIEHSFPVAQFEIYTDEDGNQRSRPVLDAQGNPVKNRESVQMRDRLLDQLASIRVPESPLDMITNHFGTDKVAEVTGRKRRVVNQRQPDGSDKKVIEKRSHVRNMADVSAFMDGKKRILIFSEAGGTGVSYHADKSVKNQQKRIHYVLQPGWRADTCLQGMGRTHRSNQAFAPEYNLVRTDLNAQKRFTSSVARRLDQMGAITRGERKAASGGLFTAADNLESQEARDALRVFFRDLVHEEIEGLDVATFETQTGLTITDEHGNLLQDNLPNIRQFLNRLLAMNIDDQNLVFAAFEDRLMARVEQAIANGTLDQGMEIYRADKIEKLSDEVVYTHPQTGSETRYVKLKVSTKTKLVSWEQVQKRKPEKYVRSIKGKHLYAVIRARAKTEAETGRIIDQYRLVSPSGAHRFIERSHIDYRYQENWESVRGADAQAEWEVDLKEVPEFHTKDEHFLTGIILPIWDKIRGKSKIYRVLTTEGEELIGRTMHPSHVSTTLKALGAETEKPQLTPEQAQTSLLAGNIELELSNEWKVRYARVQNENRIEIVGPNFQNDDELEMMGVFKERIGYRPTRYFIPSKDAEVMKGVLARWPLVEINYLHTEDPGVQMESPMGGFVGGRPASAKLSAIVKENMSTGSSNADSFLRRTKGYTKTGQPGLLRRTAGHIMDTFREFHYLPDLPKTRDFADIREHFRHTEEISKRATEYANNKGGWALKPIEGISRETRKRMQALEMKLIADDMAEDVEKGVELPPGITAADVMIMQTRAQELYDKYPTVRQAYDRLREVTTEIGDMLIEEGMLTKEQAKEFYFPHKVVKYLRNEDGFFGLPGRKPADYKKGYLKQRKGGYDYSTDIMERLVEHWAQVRRDVEYRRFLEKVLKEEQANWFKAEYPEWTEFTKTEDGKRVRNLVPEGYKEVTVLPGRYYYQTHGVTEDMAKALMEQNLDSIEELLDDETAGKVRKVLAMGKKKSFIVREPIARQIHNMPTMAISTNPAYLAVKGFNSFVKGQILFNPLYAVPFHLTNFTGDAHKVFVALPSALKGRILARYWQDVIKAHGGEKSFRFEKWQQTGVIGSGWIGVDIPQLKTIIPVIEKAELSGVGKYSLNKIKQLWNLAKKAGAGREDWLRYALAERLWELQEQGKDISKYAIKDSHMISSISDPYARVAKVARDIAGDYAAIGRTGKMLSDLVVPFYRWMHLNLPWWPRMMKEYAKKGQAGRLSQTLMAAALPYILATLWNYSDDDRRKYEKSLPPWKRWNFHIIGYRGKKMYYVPLPLDDVANFIGIPEDILDYQRYQRGMIDMPELLKRIAINSTYEPGMSVVNAVGGAAGVVRDLLGVQTYPEIKPWLETRWGRKALNVAGDIFGAPAQLGKALEREGIKIDPETGEIILGPRTKDTLNRSWMGIRPYSVDIGRTAEMYGKSVYKRTSLTQGQIIGQPHKGKKRLVDSLTIQLEGAE